MVDAHTVIKNSIGIDIILPINICKNSFITTTSAIKNQALYQVVSEYIF